MLSPTLLSEDEVLNSVHIQVVISTNEVPIKLLPETKPAPSRASVEVMKKYNLI